MCGEPVPEGDGTNWKTEAYRWRLAATHRIPPADVELFLTGDDEAALATRAEHLGRRFDEQRFAGSNVAPSEGRPVGPGALSTMEHEFRQFVGDLFDRDVW